MHIAKNSLIFCVGLLLATILAELGLRLIELTPLWKVLPVAEVSIYGPDEYTGYNIRRNVSGIWITENRSHVLTSPQGLRDRDTPFTKPENIFRIALVGDSITESLQVELDENFSSLIESILSIDDKKVEVINLGISGAPPTVQVARMKSLGSQFQPDVMLYIINVSDFLSDVMGQSNVLPGYKKNEDGEYYLSYDFRQSAMYKFRTSRLGEIYYWSLDHSRVARVLNSRKNHGIGLGLQAQVKLKAPVCKDVAANLMSQLEVSGDDASVRGRFLAFLRDAKETASQSKSQLVLALRGLHTSCDEVQNAKLDSWKRIYDYLKRQNVEAINLEKAIFAILEQEQDKPDLKRIYGFGAHVGRGHLNQYGHSVFARAISNEIRNYLPIKRK